MNDFALALGRGRRGVLAKGFVLAAFLLLPIVIIIPTSLTASNFVEFPPQGISTRWYSEFGADPAWTGAFRTSLFTSVGATVFATVLGTAAALGVRHLVSLERFRRSARSIRTLFILPAVVPLVGYALGLFNVFEAIAQATTFWPIVVGQGMLAFPLVFITVSAGLARVPPNITRAAFSLGAGWPVVVLRVELPLVVGNVVAGAVFAFASAFDEVVIAFFFNTPDTTTLPVQMFLTARDSVTPVMAAAATLVMAIAFVMAGLAATALRLRARTLTSLARKP